MRVAFYAPLKPPDHPVPSGDRRMAGLLMEALRLGGHQVELACRLRSRDGEGNPGRQARIKDLGGRLARRLIGRYKTRPGSEWPEAWLTYHLYYKAPDWIGPEVSKALGIPYLVAEASVAPKRSGGPWDIGHRATLEALDRAAAVITLNPGDSECLPDQAKVRPLKPFLAAAPFLAAGAARDVQRAALARKLGLPADTVWLLAVAMMRPGDKLSSYRLLAHALEGLEREDWHLIVVGQGPAQAEVEAAFVRIDRGKVRFVGQTGQEALLPFYGSCDLFVWPAINEAYGMALLEAQAAGLPVVAGAAPGVAAIVADGTTGVLTMPGDDQAFAAAVGSLISDQEQRARLSRAARLKAETEHDLTSAARRLDAILREAAGS